MSLNTRAPSTQTGSKWHEDWGMEGGDREEEVKESHLELKESYVRVHIHANARADAHAHTHSVA